MKQVRATCPDPRTPEVVGQVTVGVKEWSPEFARSYLLAALVGDIEREGWPPTWPNKTAHPGSDEWRIGLLADALRLDPAEWSSLCTEACELAARPEFARLETAFAYLLEEGHVLDEHAVKQVEAIVGGKRMEHLTKTARAVVTDAGIFEALAAAWTIDRQGERLARGAFRRTITRWRNSGRPVPLRWDHKGDPEYIIGAIDQLRETSDGLRVRGKLDLEESKVRERLGEQCEAGLSACLSGS